MCGGGGGGGGGGVIWVTPHPPDVEKKKPNLVGLTRYSFHLIVRIHLLNCLI